MTLQARLTFAYIEENVSMNGFCIVISTFMKQVQQKAPNVEYA